MNQKKFWVKAIGMALCAALLLTGCSGGGTSGSDTSAKKTDASSSSSSDVSSSEGPKDYSKYNAYMGLYDELSDMEDILFEYFMNVDYTEDFALVEGGDYAAIKDVVEYYTGRAYVAREALEYVDEEPSYPEVDAAVRALGDSPEKMMDALEDLASYMLFDDYKDDNLAKAPEIHAAIWDALQVFGPYYGEMMDAMDALADEIRDEDMEDMLNNGEMVLYHSRMMIHSSQDILNDIWSQIEGAIETMDPEAEFVLPEIDGTNLAPLFAQFNTAYEELTTAMSKAEELEKVFTGPTAETAAELYSKKVDSLYIRMGELANALNEGLDYSEAYDSANEALNSMIDGYNAII